MHDRNLKKQICGTRVFFGSCRRIRDGLLSGMYCAKLYSRYVAIAGIGDRQVTGSPAYCRARVLRELRVGWSSHSFF